MGRHMGCAQAGRDRPRGRSMLLAAVLAATLAAATGAGAADWPRFRGDLRNSGFNPRETILSPANVDRLSVKWSGLGRGTPMIHGGVVFIFGGQGKTFAYDRATGAKTWEADGASSFLAAADGLVHTVSTDGRLLAFDEKTGAQVWSRKINHQRNDSGLNLDGGVLYVFDRDGVSAYVAKDGTPVWNNRLSGQSIGAPAIVGEVVYANATVEVAEPPRAQPKPGDPKPDLTNPDVVLAILMAETPRPSDVYALNRKDGAVIWHAKLDGITRSSPAVVDGMVYVGTYLGTVYALDATTGAVVWKSESAARGGMQTSAAVAGGLVYFNSMKGVITAFDAKTGKEVWTLDVKAPFISSPAVANGVLYTGAFDKKAYALDARTGKVLWTYAARHAITSSPAVVDGTLYIGSDVVAADGQIHAFSLPAGGN